MSSEDSSKKTLRVLHTSDTHIGKKLYDRQRYGEHKELFGWLLEEINNNAVEVLLIAGDVFDKPNPSNEAQGIYYKFISSLKDTTCRHVVISAGNHDSPSFIDAPKTILESLNTVVVGALPNDPQDQVITLYDDDKRPEMIVCAVPFLRYSHVANDPSGQGYDEREAAYKKGVREHFDTLKNIAELRRDSYGLDIPIVAMGHLFTQGGKTEEGDGVKNHSVGTADHISSDVFTSGFDYVALGHLHIPQLVNGFEHIRYSGSPLPMSFKESSEQKTVCLIDFDGKNPVVSTIDISKFQRLERIKGDMDEINSLLDDLKGEDESIWLDIEYEGTSIIPDLKEQIKEKLVGTNIEVLRLKTLTNRPSILDKNEVKKELEELTPDYIFAKLLDLKGYDHSERKELIETFNRLQEDFEAEQVK